MRILNIAGLALGVGLMLTGNVLGMIVGFSLTVHNLERLAAPDAPIIKGDRGINTPFDSAPVQTSNFPASKSSLKTSFNVKPAVSAFKTAYNRFGPPKGNSP